MSEEIKIKIGNTEINKDLIKVNDKTAQNVEEASVFLLSNGNSITVQDNPNTNDFDESSISDIASVYFLDDGQTAESIGLQQREDGLYQVSIVSWGSRAKNGMRYANDCLSRIIANYYPSADIKLYSENYDALIDKIMQINGITNPDLIYAGNAVILPVPVFGEEGKLIGFIGPEDIETPENVESPDNGISELPDNETSELPDNEETTANYEKGIDAFSNLKDSSTPADYAVAVATLASLAADPSANFDLNDFKTMYAIKNGKSFEDYIRNIDASKETSEEKAILAFLDGVDPMTQYASLDGVKNTTNIENDIETILKLSNDDFTTLYKTNTALQTYINDASSNATIKTLLDYKVSSLDLEESEGDQGNGDGADGGTDNNNVTAQLMSDETTKTMLNMLGINQDAVLTYDEDQDIYKSNPSTDGTYYTLSKDSDGTWTQINYDANGATSNSQITVKNLDNNTTEYTVSEYNGGEQNEQISTTTYTQNDNSWTCEYTPEEDNATTANMNIDIANLTASVAKEIFDKAIAEITTGTPKDITVGDKTYTITKVEGDGSWKIEEKASGAPEGTPNLHTLVSDQVDLASLKEGVSVDVTLDEQTWSLEKQGEFYTLATSSTITNKNGDKITTTSQRTYNKDGVITSMSIEKSNSPASAEEGASGTIVSKETKQFQDGKLSEINTVTYDEEGKLILGETGERFIGESKYEYTGLYEGGEKIAEFRTTGNANEYKIVEYDEEGNALPETITLTGTLEECIFILAQQSVFKNMGINLEDLKTINGQTNAFEYTYNNAVWTLTKTEDGWSATESSDKIDESQTIKTFDSNGVMHSTTTYTKNNDSWDYTYTPAGDDATATTISIDNANLTASEVKEIFVASREAVNNISDGSTTTETEVNGKFYTVNKEDGSWKIEEKAKTPTTGKPADLGLDVEVFTQMGLAEVELTPVEGQTDTYTYTDADDKQWTIAKDENDNWIQTNEVSKVVYNADGQAIYGKGIVKINGKDCNYVTLYKDGKKIKEVREVEFEGNYVRITEFDENGNVTNFTTRPGAIDDHVYINEANPAFDYSDAALFKKLNISQEGWQKIIHEDGTISYHLDMLNGGSSSIRQEGETYVQKTSTFEKSLATADTVTKITYDANGNKISETYTEINEEYEPICEYEINSWDDYGHGEKSGVRYKDGVAYEFKEFAQDDKWYVATALYPKDSDEENKKTIIEIFGYYYSEINNLPDETIEFIGTIEEYFEN